MRRGRPQASLARAWLLAAGLVTAQGQLEHVVRLRDPDET